MTYSVLLLKNEEELSDCPVFQIDQFNWGGDYRPVSFGRMGFLLEKGFLLEMECQETNPRRLFTKDGEPVYQDSAMEAFFCFQPEKEAPCYLNFEMNANGAMLACYGNSRKNRQSLFALPHEGLCCQASIKESSWQVRLFVPITLLREVYPKLTLSKGSRFTCNFYKIKESEGLTHFASFAPITAPSPDFHLPAFFAKAVLCS